MRSLSWEQKISTKANKAFEYLSGTALSLLVTGMFYSMFSLNIFHELSVPDTNIGGGLVRVWNSIADTVGNSDFFILEKYAGGSESSFIFTVVLIIAFSSINIAVIKSKVPVFFIMYIIPFAVFQLIWDITPSIYLAFTFIGVLLLVLVYSAYGGMKANIILNFAVVTVLALGVCALLYDNLELEKSQQVKELGKNLQNSIKELRYGESLPGDGNLGKTGSRNVDDANALTVTMDRPASLYLRGFVGGRYTDDGFSSLDNAVYYENRDLFYWLHKQDFSGVSQMYRSASLTEKNLTGSAVSIEVERACREYVYHPYETVDNKIGDSVSYADSFLRTTGLRGDAQYSFHGADNLASHWPKLAATLFSKRATPELTEYRRLESHYNVFLYENYTDLSPDLEQVIYKAIGDKGDQTKGHMGYKEAISSIRKYLEENIVYTETVNPSQENDFIKTFLKAKKGYDIHYAAAATMMFRYYGIPARFVSGYIITPKDVKKAGPAGEIKVPSKNLHSWTEIYIDSFGWVPLEVTPEYYDKMNQPDMTKGLESETSIAPYKEQNAGGITDSGESEQEKEKSIFPWKTLAVLLLIVLILGALIFLLYKLMRMLIRVIKRDMSFRQPDVRKAVCCIYSSMRGKGGDIPEKVKELGEKAAYSLHPVDESDRKYMLENYKKMKG